ncbi:hypothetical protein DMUE_3188 [Dictyocoela muelleri]|nr:hypothetical protein DMUE_3188 [Dictyocoela muelleri]
MDETRKKLQKHCDKYNNMINKNKKKITYRVNDMILMKNQTQDKISPPLIGLFKVIYVSKSGKNLFIDKENKSVRVSVKMCRPFVEWSGCGDPYHRAVKESTTILPLKLTGV